MPDTTATDTTPAVADVHRPVRDNPIAVAGRAILAIGADTPDDRVAEIRNAVTAIAEASRDLTGMFNRQLLDVMTETGRDIVVGPDVRLYLGVERDWKVRDPAAMLDAMLAAVDGDVAKVAGCLGAGAWKAGAVRSTLDEAGCPDRFDELVERVEKAVVKDGKPVKKVLVADGRFSR